MLTAHFSLFYTSTLILLLGLAYIRILAILAHLHILCTPYSSKFICMAYPLFYWLLFHFVSYSLWVLKHYMQKDIPLNLVVIWCHTVESLGYWLFLYKFYCQMSMNIYMVLYCKQLNLIWDVDILAILIHVKMTLQLISGIPQNQEHVDLMHDMSLIQPYNTPTPD